MAARPIRPLATVVLPEEQMAAIVEDCHAFERSEEWCAARPSSPRPPAPQRDVTCPAIGTKHSVVKIPCAVLSSFVCLGPLRF